MAWNDFLFGTPATQERELVSNLTSSQLKGQRNLENAANQRGAKGAFGTSADYYRDLLSNENADLQAFQAPEMRRFNEQIIPDLAEQFAGMGSGGLSSSGFRNAAVGAGTDLSERLGAIRAALRQQGAEGLQQIGQQALNPHSQWETTSQTEGTPGLLGSISNLAGNALSQFGGQAVNNLFSGSSQPGNQQKGSTGAYGNKSGFSSTLPDFNPRMR